MVITVELIDI